MLQPPPAPPAAEHVDLLGVPLEYLESYPLAAFVLRVRAPMTTDGMLQALKDQPPLARPIFASRDTDVTIRQLRASHPGGRSPSASSDGTSTEESTSELTDDDASSRSSDVTPVTASVSDVASGYTVPSATSSPGPLKSSSSSTSILSNHVLLRPVSAPLSSRISIVWANSHGHAITRNRNLYDIVEPHSLAALQEWAETDSVRLDDSEPAPATIFPLEIGHPLQIVDLVKTRPPPSSADSDYTLVILTATSAPRPLEGAGPRGLDNKHPSPKTTSLVLPATRTRGETAEIKDGDKYPVAAQCHLLFETMDWSNHPLGPPSTWTSELVAMITSCFSSFTRDCIFVGEEFYMIYNQNYSTLVPHPESFARPWKEVWSPFWPQLSPIANKVLAGEPHHFEDACALHMRKDLGRFIERYHTYSLIPIVDNNKKVVGIYNPSRNTTERVLADRRSETVHELIQRISNMRSRADFFNAVAAALEGNPADAPFAICYTVKENTSVSNPRDGLVNVDLELASTLGVPDGHSSAPRKLRFSLTHPASSASANPTESRSSLDASPLVSSDQPLPTPKFEFLRTEASPSQSPSPSPTGSTQTKLSARASPAPSTTSYLSRSRRASKDSEVGQTEWPIAQALSLRQCVVVEDCSRLVQGFPIRQWAKLPDMAVVIPLAPESAPDLPPGVMILGLNVHRTLDADYEDWIQQVRGHLTSFLSATIVHEDSVDRDVGRGAFDRVKMAWFRDSAHEFHTPLTLISGPLEDLRNTDLDSNQRQQLNMVLKNVHRLQQLASSLLNISRMEGGQVKATFVWTDLNELVVEIAGLLRSALEHLGLQLRVVAESPPPEGPIQFSVDPVMVEMLISNLLLVASRIVKGGPVMVRLRYEGDYAILAVTDQGVDNATLSYLDMPSYDSSSSSPALQASLAGMDISLALVDEIVRLHNGTFHISSLAQEGDGDGPGNGTMFVVRLPLSVEAVPARSRDVAPRGGYARKVGEEIMASREDLDGGGGLHSPTGSSSLQENSDRSLSGLMFEPSDRLLVVDTNKDLREYIKNIFEPFCSVTDVGTVGDAQRAIKEVHPDLILSDERMVDGTGLELLAMARSDPIAKVTPVVLLSANADDESHVDALIRGAEDYITKPFKSRELLLRVHLHMQMGKKRAKLEKLFAEREQEIAVLSDYCPSGIMRTDANGFLTYANAAFLGSGDLPPSVNLEDWISYCDPESLATVYSTWREVIYGDRTTTKIQWKWKNGRTMSGVFIRLDKFNPAMSGIIGCVTDISYQMERLTQAEMRRREAEESKHQQELLVDLISHEIRTPVSAILQCSSLVKENLVALKQQLRFAGDQGFRPSAELLSDLEDDVGALDSIFQCGLVQERIAGDVLSLARIQLDMLSLHDVPMQLRREAQKVLSVFSSEARMKKIDIKLQFGPTLSLLGVQVIKTDPVRLGQVITNLISNAIRFTATSEVRTITVTYNIGLQPPPSGSYVCPNLDVSSRNTMHSAPPEDTPVYLFISVRDTGPGMTPAEREVLFQRFHQGNKMIHTRYGGSGLGLFICKKISELLGGGIEVQSELGKGCVFNLYIKALTVDPTTLPDLFPARSHSSSFAPSVGGSTTSSSVSSSGSLSPGISRIKGSSFSSPPTLSPDSPSVLCVSPDSTVLGSPQPLAASMMAVDGVEAHDGKQTSPHPLNILIVEDNIINQTVLKRQVLKGGFTCDVANNGQEALVKIYEAHRRSRLGDPLAYDVILMDLEMPVMDGLTALKHIREAEATGALGLQLVIALTGNARQGQIEEALRAGMDDVVVKPYRFPELVAKMQRAVAELRAKQAGVMAPGH